MTMETKTVIRLLVWSVSAISAVTLLFSAVKSNTCAISVNSERLRTLEMTVKRVEIIAEDVKDIKSILMKKALTTN